MKILVCIKAVPDSRARFRINAAGTGCDLSGLALHVNEYDLYAMEEAVRIKERIPGSVVEAVTVGPPGAEAALRKAMSLGADEGALIDDSAAPAADALEVASRLAACAGPRRYDLVLCGVMSEDLMRCQTGPMLAELLGLPCATTVAKLELAADRRSLECERELAGGAREVVRLPLPALLTIQSGINTPRYASLSNVLRVKQATVPVVPAAALGPARRAETAVRAWPAEKSASCRFLEGSLEEVAEQLIAEIHRRTALL